MGLYYGKGAGVARWMGLGSGEVRGWDLRVGCEGGGEVEDAAGERSFKDLSFFFFFLVYKVRTG